MKRIIPKLIISLLFITLSSILVQENLLTNNSKYEIKSASPYIYDIGDDFELGGKTWVVSMTASGSSYAITAPIGHGTLTDMIAPMTEFQKNFDPTQYDKNDMKFQRLILANEGFANAFKFAYIPPIESLSLDKSSLINNKLGTKFNNSSKEYYAATLYYYKNSCSMKGINNDTPGHSIDLYLGNCSAAPSSTIIYDYIPSINFWNRLAMIEFTPLADGYKDGVNNLYDSIIGTITPSGGNGGNPETFTYSVDNPDFKVVKEEVNGQQVVYVKVAKSSGIPIGTHKFTVTAEAKISDTISDTPTTGEITIEVIGDPKRIEDIKYTADTGKDEIYVGDSGDLGKLEAIFGSYGMESVNTVKFSKLAKADDNDNDYFIVTDAGIVSAAKAFDESKIYKLAVKAEEYTSTGVLDPDAPVITKTFNFEVKKPAITSLSLAYNYDTGGSEFTYGDAAVSKDGLIGSLSYTGGMAGSDIYTFVDAADNDTNHDTLIIKGNEIHVKPGADLTVGTYSMRIKITDGAGATLVKEFSFKVNAKSQTMIWNDDTDILSSLYYGDTAQLGVKNLVGDGVTYGKEGSDTCVNISNSGAVTVTCIPSGNITFTATSVHNDNYTDKTIKKTIEIKKRPITLVTKLKDIDGTFKAQVNINYGDDIPDKEVTLKSGSGTLATSETLSTLGTLTYQYKDGNNIVNDPNMKPNKTYDVIPVFSGGTVGYYEITIESGKLKVENAEIIDADYYTLSGTEGKNDWYTSDVEITPINTIFKEMDINNSGTWNTTKQTYRSEGSNQVTLAFRKPENNAIRVATPTIKIDKTRPVVTNITYASKNRNVLQNLLNAISFDHIYRDAQVATFDGSDQGGSEIDTYEYTLIELDNDGNEIAGSSTTSKGNSVELEANKNYKLSVYAYDKAGNKSEKAMTHYVQISDQAGVLDVKANINGDENKPYDGSKWSKDPIEITLTNTNNSGTKEYLYSIDGENFISLNTTNKLTIQNTKNIDNVTYTFKAIGNNDVESISTLQVKIDKTMPDFEVKATTEDGEINDNDIVTKNVNLQIDALTTNLSGVTYYYTIDADKADTDPLDPASGWTKYNNSIAVSEKGEHTYYFKAASGAGNVSVDPVSFSFQIKDESDNAVSVSITSNNKRYTPGTWTNHDVTFNIHVSDEDLPNLVRYEYATTTASSTKPDDSAWQTINQQSTSQHVLTANTNGTYYWFRAVTNDGPGKISNANLVYLDVENPDNLTMKAVADKKDITLDAWVNKDVTVTFNADDNYTEKEDMRYEYQEVNEKGEASIWKTYTSKITYKNEIKVKLNIKAIDLAGNETIINGDKFIMVDSVKPVIEGIKDKGVYYLPKYVTCIDNFSGLKDSSCGTGSLYSSPNTYTIKASDQAGNTNTMTFTIKGLPDIDELDKGPQLDDAIKDVEEEEYKDIKEKLDEDQKKEIEDWIDKAKEKQSRVDKIVDETTDGSISGIDTDFDSKTKLVIADITNKFYNSAFHLDKDEVIDKVYNVEMLLNDKVIQPDGKVLVSLPMAKKPKKVILIDKEGKQTEISFTYTNGVVQFETDKLHDFVIVKDKEKEVPAPDPDDENKKDWLNKDTDHDGYPDINLDLDGDDIPELNVDIDGDGIPDVNIDSDGDGKADINIDLNNDGEPDLNIVKLKKWTPNHNVTKDGKIIYDTMKGIKPEINIDSDGDGKADINIDDDGDGKPDRNIDTNGDGTADKNISNSQTSTVKGVSTVKGGALTGDTTNWTSWWIMMILSAVTFLLSHTWLKKHRS